MKTSIFLILFVSLTLPLFGADMVPGSQNIYSGAGARESALGYTGFADLGAITGNAWNPASAADLRRVATTLNLGGLGSSDFLGGLGFYFPTVSGVYGVQLDYLNTNWGAPGLHVGGISASVAKQITANLYWGAALNFREGFFGAANDWALSLDTGILVGKRSSETGVGFLDFMWGVAVKNLGKPLYSSLTNLDPFPPITIGGGISFFPLRFDNYRMKLSADLSVPVYPFNVAFGVGMENVFFDLFSLRAGYTLAGTNFGVAGAGMNILPLTLGAGINFKLRVNSKNTNSGGFIDLAFGRSRLEDSTDVDLSWSMLNQNWHGHDEWANSVKLSVAWGSYDAEAPSLQSAAATNFFSPNFDGVQDTVKIALQMKDNTMVTGWMFDILSNGRVVRSWNSIDRLEIRNLTIEKFFSQIFSVKSEVEIPKDITWDGFDQTGKPVSDGVYSYILTAWDENGNTNRSVTGTVTVDTVVPAVKVKADYAIFSPNGDSNQDTLHLAIESANVQTSDRVTAAFFDSNGNAVKNWEFVSSCPSNLEWDGTDNKTNPVPEGAYRFVIAVRDDAGSSAKAEIAKIDLVTNYQVAAIAVSAPVFSPGGDGILDTAVFTPTVSDGKGLLRWRIPVYDAGSNLVREFSGSNELPKEIVWNGEDQAGRRLPDGVYRFRLELGFDSGNVPVSASGTVEIDTTAPGAVLKPKFLAFAPGTGGAQDNLPFDQSWSGKDDDVFEARILDSLGTAVYYDRFARKDAQAAFVWNGLDKEFKPLPEGRYTYIVEGVDAVGNRSVTQVKDLFLKNGRDKANLLADVAAFSPGSETAISKAVFTATVSSTNELTNFLLEVRDSAGKPLRQWHSAAFQPATEWDGKGDDGNRLPDGIYQYQLRLAYTYDPNVKSAVRSVKLDTAAPQVNAKAADWIFSPNEDSRKETLSVKLDASGEAQDAFTAVFADESGKPVRSYRWAGKVPAELSWNGKDDKGAFAPEGLYSFVLTGSDAAKNRAESVVPKIKLVRAFETVTLSAATNAFTPSQGALRFTGTLSSTNDLLQSVLAIRDEAGNLVRSYAKDKGFDGEWKWDGKNDQGAPQPDGRYMAQITAEFESGNLVFAGVRDLMLGNGAPAYKLATAPEVFTPDGDGENDTLYITLEVSNYIGVKDWQLTAYKRNDDNTKGNAFKHWSGTGNTRQVIAWDGTGDDKQDTVESVQDYLLELQATDNLGNKVSNAQLPFPVGVLVDRTPDGIRIRVSSIQFQVDTPNMIGNYKKNLDKVILIIRKILSDRAKYGLPENAKIEISGHADDTGEALRSPDGSQSLNDWLSTQRAKAVYSYFLDRDIDPKQLTEPVGYGSRRPFKPVTPEMSPEKKKDYRARNRRVEFFIKK